MIIVTTDEVVRAVQKRDTGKSSGLDGIFAEHLLHCSERLLSMLAVCITGFFVHGFLPDNMLSTVLVPVIWGNSLSDPFHVNNGVRQGILNLICSMCIWMI